MLIAWACNEQSCAWIPGKGKGEINPTYNQALVDRCFLQLFGNESEKRKSSRSLDTHAFNVAMRQHR